MDSMLKLNRHRFSIFSKQDEAAGCFDVTFQFPCGNTLHSHRFILSSMSEAFVKMFGENWHQKEAVIRITSNTLQEFRTFLEFGYAGYEIIDDNNIFCLVDIAECYDVVTLRESCRHYIVNNINGNTFFDYYKLALAHHLLDVHKAVLTEFSRYSVDWVTTDQFYEASKDFILEIVQLEDMEACEEWLFQCIYEWGRRRCDEKKLNIFEHLKIELEDILPHIRFPIMKLEFLTQFVLENGFLFSYQELSNIMQDATVISKNRNVAMKTPYSCNYRRRVISRSSNGSPNQDGQGPYNNNLPQQNNNRHPNQAYVSPPPQGPMQILNNQAAQFFQQLQPLAPPPVHPNYPQIMGPPPPQFQMQQGRPMQPQPQMQPQGIPMQQRPPPQQPPQQQLQQAQLPQYRNRDQQQQQQRIPPPSSQMAPPRGPLPPQPSHQQQQRSPPLQQMQQQGAPPQAGLSPSQLQRAG